MLAVLSLSSLFFLTFSSCFPPTPSPLLSPHLPYPFLSPFVSPPSLVYPLILLFSSPPSSIPPVGWRCGDNEEAETWTVSLDWTAQQRREGMSQSVVLEEHHWRYYCQ